MQHGARVGGAGVRRVGLAQLGGAPWDPAGTSVAEVCEYLQRAMPAVELLVLSELSTTPYFPASTDRRWLECGTTVDGLAMRPFQALARALDAEVVVPFAERDSTTGVLYNAAAVFGRDGQPLPGTYVSGPRAGCATLTYRKVHLSQNLNAGAGVHERYFFRGGDGFVTFESVLGRLGILICYDRSFPEAWRALRLAGTEVVALPLATSRPERTDMLAHELEVAAVHNGVFVLAASKGGLEMVGDAVEVVYHGASAVVSPLGSVLARGPERHGPEVVSAEVDSALLRSWGAKYQFLRDLRPDAYVPSGGGPSAGAIGFA